MMMLFVALAANMFNTLDYVTVGRTFRDLGGCLFRELLKGKIKRFARKHVEQTNYVFAYSNGVGYNKALTPQT
jgi:hypothetical protein